MWELDEVMKLKLSPLQKQKEKCFHSSNNTGLQTFS